MFWTLVLLALTALLVWRIAVWAKKWWFRETTRTTSFRSGGGGGGARSIPTPPRAFSEEDETHDDADANAGANANVGGGDASLSGVSKASQAMSAALHILGACRAQNPALTRWQEAHLRQMVGRAMERDRGMRAQMASGMRALLALALPDVASALALAEDLWPVEEQEPTNDAPTIKAKATKSTKSTSTMTTTADVDAVLLKELHDDYGIVMVNGLTNQDVANALKKAILMSPICPITMEELFVSGAGGKKRIVPDVAMLVRGESDKHVFLFKRAALSQWFAASSRATNPLTREAIDPVRDVIVLS